MIGKEEEMLAGSTPAQAWRRRAACVTKALSTVLGASGVLVFLTACTVKKQVLVEVMHPPKIAIPAKVKEIDIEEFQGPVECAKSLKPKLITKVTESGVYTVAVPGLSDPEDTLMIKGTVTTCALSQGSGTLNTVFSAWYMGDQVHQGVVDEHTNRPGAPPNEVRDALIDRVMSRTAKAIFPMKKKEIRTFLPVDGDNDTGVTAAAAGNWPLAVESFGKQVKEKPTEHRVWYNRGIAYEVTGQFKLALNDLRKAIDLKRSDLYVEALARVDRGMQNQKSIEDLKKNPE